MYLELIFDVQKQVFGVELVDVDSRQFSLSVADAKNISEALELLSSDPADCNVARIWLDPKGIGGYIDFR